MKFNLDKILILCGFVGPLIFFLTIYFLFPLFFPGYNLTDDFISELGAVGSPVKILASVFGFSLFGIFIMLFALGLFRLKEVNSLGKIAAFFIFITGILMYLVGIFPCDVACENFSARGDLHQKTSDYQFPILALGFVIFAFSISGNEKLKWLTPVILILGLATLFLAYFLFFVRDLQNIGIWQRAAIGLPYVIMMIIAWGLYKKNFS